MYYEEMEKLIHDAETYQFQELSKRVKEAIDTLPASYREAFVMHRFTKKSYKEIAESSGGFSKNNCLSYTTGNKAASKRSCRLTNYYDRLCIVSRSLTIAHYLLLKKRTFLKKEYLISQGML